MKITISIEADEAKTQEHQLSQSLGKELEQSVRNVIRKQQQVGGILYSPKSSGNP